MDPKLDFSLLHCEFFYGLCYIGSFLFSTPSREGTNKGLEKLTDILIWAEWRPLIGNLPERMETLFLSWGKFSICLEIVLVWWLLRPISNWNELDTGSSEKKRLVSYRLPGENKTAKLNELLLPGSDWVNRLFVFCIYCLRILRVCLHLTECIELKKWKL